MVILFKIRGTVVGPPDPTTGSHSVRLRRENEQKWLLAGFELAP